MVCSTSIIQDTLKNLLFDDADIIDDVDIVDSDDACQISIFLAVFALWLFSVFEKCSWYLNGAIHVHTFAWLHADWSLIGASNFHTLPHFQISIIMAKAIIPAIERLSSRVMRILYNSCRQEEFLFFQSDSYFCIALC